MAQQPKTKPIPLEAHMYREVHHQQKDPQHWQISSSECQKTPIEEQCPTVPWHTHPNALPYTLCIPSLEMTCV